MRRARTVSSLAFAALALAALALPAFASAGEWTQNGEPLTEEAVIELDGTYGYKTGYGTFQCGVHGEATLVPGSEGEISNLVTTSAPCTGSFLGCKVSPQFKTPWPMTARTNDILVSEATETWILPSCGNLEITMEGSMELAPDNREEISSFYLEGLMVDSVSSIPLIVSGELEVSPPWVYGF